MVLRRSSLAKRWPPQRQHPSAAGEGQSECGHFLAVANQQDVTGQHRVVPGLALDRREPRELGELIGGRLDQRSEEHTSELQSRSDLVCRLLLEKKKKTTDGPARRRT